MKIYSRDIFFQKFTNKYGKTRERKICAPCQYEKHKPMEIGDNGASRCKTQFIDENGKILGLCECVSIHDKVIRIK